VGGAKEEHAQNGEQKKRFIKYGGGFFSIIMAPQQGEN